MSSETHIDGPAALRSQVHALHDAAFAWALTCARGRREDAEEILQEAYAKVISGRARFHGRSSFKTWFFAVIRVTTIEQRRSGFARVFNLARFRGRSVERISKPADEKVDAAADARALREAMCALPDRQAEIVHLVFYEGLTVEEAALTMALSVGSARTHYHRAKESLRAKLARPRDEDPAMRSDHDRA